MLSLNRKEPPVTSDQQQPPLFASPWVALFLMLKNGTKRPLRPQPQPD